MFLKIKVFFKEIKIFIQQGCIKLIKCDSEYFYIVTNSIFHKNRSAYDQYNCIFLKYYFKRN